MGKLIKYLLSLAFAYGSLLSFAQSKIIDSLQVELSRSQEDTIKVNLQIELAEELYYGSHL